MRTKTKNKHQATSSRPRKNINPGKEAAHPSPPGGRARQMAASLQGPGIYTVKLNSIPGLHVIQSQGEALQVDECISDQLYSCYLQYCKVNKHKPAELRIGEEAKRVNSIYNEMELLVKKVSKKIHINIDKSESGQYYFTAYYFFNNSDTIWAFPLEFLKLLSEEYPSLGEVAIPFFSKVLYQIGFSDFNSNGHLEYLISEYDNQMDMFGEDEMDIEARILSAEQMQNYLPGGDAQDYLKKLRHPKRMNIRDRLNRLRPKQDRFKFLKNWMLEGLKLYEDRNWININSFDYRHETGNDYGNDYADRVEADRIYTIVWTINDFIWDQYEEGINMDIGEFGVVEPIGFHLINQKQNKPLQMNTWFNEWIMWFDRGMVAICKYLEDKKKNERHNQSIIVTV